MTSVVTRHNLRLELGGFCLVQSTLESKLRLANTHQIGYLLSSVVKDSFNHVYAKLAVKINFET